MCCCATCAYVESTILFINSSSHWVAESSYISYSILKLTSWNLSPFRFIADNKTRGKLRENDSWLECATEGCECEHWEIYILCKVVLWDGRFLSLPLFSVMYKILRCHGRKRIGGADGYVLRVSSHFSRRSNSSAYFLSITVLILPLQKQSSFHFIFSISWKAWLANLCPLSELNSASHNHP